MTSPRYVADSELEREIERDLQEGDEDLGELEVQHEVADASAASEGDDPEERFAEGLYELSQREFESDQDADDALSRLLGEMEREFFFKKLVKKAKRAGRKLLSKGMKQLGSRFPAIQAITQLARGNLKGALGGLAKTALTAGVGALPGGAAALPALQALGFESGMDAHAQREAWSRYVGLVREAYEDLAVNLSENADDPIEASRLASESFRTALRRSQGHRNGAGRAPAGADGPRHVRLHAGERLVIEVA